MIDEKYAEFRFINQSLDTIETYEFRSSYIPTHLDYDPAFEPYAMKYLIDKGYLRAPYFNWETKTVTA